MKNRILILILGLALGLGTTNRAGAMSEFASMVITQIWPETSTPGNTIYYEVAVERVGQGVLDIQMTCAGLPTNCVTTFENNAPRFTGRDPRYQYFLMTVTCSQPTATDTYSFTVTGTSRRESITVTNTFHLPERLGTAAPNLVSVNPLGDGNVEVRGLGSTAQTYQIESTTDLANPAWTHRGSCIADGNGRFYFNHSGGISVGKTAQFYRAVLNIPGTP